MYTPSCTASNSRANAAARSSPTRLRASWRVTGGVGVLVLYCGVHFRSMAARMLTGSAPELYSCIDSRATSTQVAQPNPWVSHSVTLPAASRLADEAHLVVAMAVGLAAAVARHEARHLGMPGRELVGGTGDGQRAAPARSRRCSAAAAAPGAAAPARPWRGEFACRATSTPTVETTRIAAAMRCACRSHAAYFSRPMRAIWRRDSLGGQSRARPRVSGIHIQSTAATRNADRRHRQRHAEAARGGQRADDEGRQRRWRSDQCCK